MKKQINIFSHIMAVAVLASLITATGVHARTWTAVNGQTIEAEYVRHAAGKIVLKKDNGKEIAISPALLSHADQTFANKQVRPKLKLSFVKKTETKSHGYDDKTEKLDCVIKIEKTSKTPYSGKLKVEAFVLGKDLSEEEITMLKAQTWSAVKLLEKSGEVLELKVEKIKIKYDDGYYNSKYGEEYYGYAIFVSDESGNIFASKASKKILLEKLRDLRKGDLEDIL